MKKTRLKDRMINLNSNKEIYIDDSVYLSVKNSVKDCVRDLVHIDLYYSIDSYVENCVWRYIRNYLND